MSTQIQYVYIPDGMGTGPSIQLEFKTKYPDGKETIHFIPLSKAEVRQLIGLLQRSLTGC